MNATLMARQAYGAAPLRDPRQAEYQVLSTVTARLAEAEALDDFPRLAGALHDNGRLWTRLASDVACDGNGLPRDLRARIFWLAQFTRAHTSRVLRGEAGPQALVEVNAAVMRGLGLATSGAAGPMATGVAPATAAPPPALAVAP